MTGRGGALLLFRRPDPSTSETTHDPSLTEKPFVRLWSDHEREVPILPLNISQLWGCMLCKNYHYRRTMRTVGDMEVHLRNV